MKTSVSVCVAIAFTVPPGRRLSRLAGMVRYCLYYNLAK